MSSKVKTAVIMAAGMGTRFGDMTETIPKGFIKVGGQSMVERSIHTLINCGIERIIIGTGYHREAYEAMARQYPQIKCHFSPRYAETNSMYTLWNCRDIIGKDDFLLLESDLVFQKTAITSLIDCPQPDLMLVTPVTKFQDQYYIQVDEDKVLSGCSTNKDELTVYGEMVGIHKISNRFYQKMCEDYALKLDNSPKLGYEFELEDISRNHLPLHVLKVDGLKWYEIDDTADLAYAEEHILPYLCCPESPDCQALQEKQTNPFPPMNIKRNILLNPGPATTTDTVKMAQVVPDICPREKEFAGMMKSLRADLLKVAHAPAEKYTSVLFCGSGTINIDICLNSLLPEGKKVLVVNNGAYSTRAVEICQYYGLPHIDLKSSVYEQPDLEAVARTLDEDPDVYLVYTTHHETGTGVLNPIREIGALAHKHGAIFVVDTTSSLGMIPFDMEADNVDFCMASAQKGLMAMTGLSFIIGNEAEIRKSKDYPKRSYYCNLYLQYDFFERTGEMHFTPPVQTIYATMQALKEYFAEGESAKFARHRRVFEAIHKGLDELGFKDVIKRELQSGLVVSVLYPNDPNWDFERIHDYCYSHGFTIYPGKISTTNTFRLCALGTIDTPDIEAFFHVLRDALIHEGVQIPISY